MTRPKSHDVDQIGRAPKRGRGLDALIPTTPAPDVRAMQWRQLEAALFSLTNAQFEYERASTVIDEAEAMDAGRVHVEDCRRALGALALSLADGPDAEGYARLLEGILTPPPSVDPVTGGE